MAGVQVLLRIKRIISRLQNPIGDERKGASVWASLEHVTVPAVQFASAIPLVYGLGVSGFGILTYLLAVASLLGVFSPGVAMAATQLISGQSKSTERASAVYLINFGGLIIISIFTVPGIMIFDLLVSSFVPLALTDFEFDASLLSLSIYCSAVVIRWDVVISSCLKAKLEYRASAITDMVGRVAGAVTLSVYAILGESIIFLILANAFFVFLRASTKTVLLLLGEVQPSLSGVLAAIRPTVRFSVLQWTQNIAAALYSFSDRIIVGIFAPASVVAVAALASQVAGQLHSVSRAFLAPVIPALITQWKNEQLSEFHRVANDASGRLTFLVIVLFLIVAFAGPLAISTALNFAVPLSVILPILFSYMVGYTFMAYSIVPYFEIIGRGKVGLSGLLAAIASSLNLGAAIVLGGVFGVIGVALSKAAFSLPYWFVARPRLGSTFVRE